MKVSDAEIAGRLQSVFDRLRGDMEDMDNEDVIVFLARIQAFAQYLIDSAIEDEAERQREEGL